jgi:hypothetical protein
MEKPMIIKRLCEGQIGSKYFQPITSTAPKITTTAEIDLTSKLGHPEASKKFYIILCCFCIKSIRFMSLGIPSLNKAVLYFFKFGCHLLHAKKLLSS